mmetsp:Transcript_24093/g.48779  ORF Transcript_24093/g.48779 Transcript_24093/m.48779 type:complete len:178 (-) Transcript_24093:175-708(-)|eukprot:CAMPEP_0183306860 /NCGR_PEP_ID=MMETSP0160_2-20130417/15027_1 /TAXON_ID=2839 ORGANISM="Odontella Sinensis, Strain Grunow 1884" /NCGR_SAMPLE_ID=MMETSP0160_2 /ASSEMBLY_ACC=CAM_ASM_000250 /LENGTH=177 /DNA_ID=CAMNT_0025470329 /DNA_START=173 /DNA_END=706 /DNA_ORIENTATION=-
MSEESKVDYVSMGENKGVKMPDGLDDPNLSQEDKDLRLAIALQQQENAAAYDAHKKKHDAAVKAQLNRTARSGTHAKLAAVRGKDHGMLSVPKEYSTDNAYVKDETDYKSPGMDMSSMKGALPQEIADAQLAKELQGVENTSAGTARVMEKIITEEQQDSEAAGKRSSRSAAGRGFA